VIFIRHITLTILNTYFDNILKGFDTITKTHFETGEYNNTRCDSELMVNSVTARSRDYYQRETVKFDINIFA
jgi:hypothetical protein